MAERTTVYVTNGWGVDHTSVVVDDLQFGCSGDVGKAGDRVLITGSGVNKNFARTIGAFDPGGSRKDYDRAFWDLKHITDPNLAFLALGDCCGLVYGVQGVCHTMANRILLAGGKRTVNFELKSASGVLSWFLYGYYGRMAVTPYVSIPAPWPLYLSLCESAHKLVSSNRVNSVAEFMYTMKMEQAQKQMKVYIDSFIKELKTSNALDDSLYVSVMQHELSNIESKDLATSRVDTFLRKNISNASNSDMNSIIDAFEQIEDTIKQAETLYETQYSQIETVNSVGFVVSRINEDFRRFDKICSETLGNERYKTLFGEDYNSGIIVVNTKKEEEKGLFAKRFTWEQVFDCKRIPWYPEPGKSFRAYDLGVPYSFIAKVSKDVVKDKVFFFEGVKGKDDTILQLSLWIADDVNKANAKCIVANGTIYGLNTYGIFYESDIRFSSEGYGYLISPVKPLNYGGDLTWQPTIGKTTKFSDLEKYWEMT